MIHIKDFCAQASKYDTTFRRVRCSSNAGQSIPAV